MKKRICSFVAAFAALVVAVTLAQGAPSVESLSVIDEAEAADLDRQSVQLRGDVTRFDVRVRWVDPAQRPPNTAASRYIRYVAKCSEKSMAVAAVATLDDDGRMLKSYVVPPGGSEFTVPVNGSREARWLQDACR